VTEIINLLVLMTILIFLAGAIVNYKGTASILNALSSFFAKGWSAELGKAPSTK
jgi:hypothetical protein